MEFVLKHAKQVGSILTLLGFLSLFQESRLFGQTYYSLSKNPGQFEKVGIIDPVILGKLALIFTAGMDVELRKDELRKVLECGNINEEEMEKYQIRILGSARINKTRKSLEKLGVIVKALRGDEEKEFKRFMDKIDKYLKTPGSFASLPRIDDADQPSTALEKLKAFLDNIKDLEELVTKYPVLVECYINFLMEESIFYYYTFDIFEDALSESVTPRKIALNALVKAARVERETADIIFKESFEVQKRLLMRLIQSLNFIKELGNGSFYEAIFSFTNDDEKRIRKFAAYYLNNDGIPRLPLLEASTFVTDKSVDPKLRIVLCQDLSSYIANGEDGGGKCLAALRNVAMDNSPASALAGDALRASGIVGAIDPLLDAAVQYFKEDSLDVCSSMMKSLNGLVQSLSDGQTPVELSDTMAQKICSIIDNKIKSANDANNNAILTIKQGTLQVIVSLGINDNLTGRTRFQGVVPSLVRPFEEVKDKANFINYNLSIILALEAIGSDANQVGVVDLLKRALFNSSDSEKLAIQKALSKITKTDR